MQGYKIQSYRHQPSVKEEEKFKVIEILSKMKAIFQSASTCLALFTTLETFIRQMEVKSSSNTSTHLQMTKYKGSNFNVSFLFFWEYLLLQA